MFRRFSDAAFDVLPFREKTEGSLKKDRTLAGSPFGVGFVVEGVCSALESQKSP